jgi:hypothetical protein
MRRSLASLVFATGAASLGAAQAPAPQIVACTELADASARLACFDREVAPFARERREAPAATSPAALPPVSPPVVAEAPAPRAPAPQQAPPPESAFGQEQLKPEDRQSTPAEAATLHARITAHRRGGQGTYLVTLDNGQVWRHEEGSRVDYLKVGAAVTISRAALGSYRMTLDDGNARNWVRVTRVR